MRNLLLVLTCLLLFFSCQQNQEQQIIEGKLNDTVEILKIAFDSAINKNLVPDVSSLFRDSLFSDSIVLLYDSILSKHIMSFKNLKFKILSKDEMCEAATKLSTENLFPNFLRIRAFEKKDSVFEVEISNRCIVPYLKSDGTLRYKKDIIGRKITQKFADSVRCQIIGMCGGQAYLRIQKINSSFKVLSTARSFD